MQSEQMASTTSASRRPNFSPGEVEKLKEEYEKRKKVLTAPFSSTITNQVKNKEWERVAAGVNQVGAKKRTGKEVKRKWENIKSEMKSKLAEKFKKGHFTRTGGGSPTGELPTSSEARMLSLIGETSVFGIDGGFDSSDLNGRLRIVTIILYE